MNQSSIDLEKMPASDLKQIIVNQRTRVAELEYRLEESCMRLRGLDEELKVREEITADVNCEVRNARKQLMDAADELTSLNQKYVQMRVKFDEARSEAKVLRETIENHGIGNSEKDARIAELEEATKSTRSRLADLRNYVEGRKAIWHQRDGEYAQLKSKVEKLERQNSELQADADRQNSIPRNTAEEDAATSARIDAELGKLRKDNERFEAYANELRIKLQDQIEATRESISMRQKLETNLEIASRMINDLTSDLDRERAISKALSESLESQKSKHERETRQIRFELSTAEQTIADQDTVNQQLASDLIDNQGFRQALEAHLNDLESENARALQKLETELGSARTRIDDYERKLRIKDSAIADLMKELADQSSKLNFSGELENALKKIDGHRPEPSSFPAKGQRITRQLIGSADGKELRFPLFRNRLSIGRTRHNDIQLDLRFVSRRHAVVATDKNGTRIIDWGSRNGVYVNKKRVSEKILKSGDVITIGLTNLRYEERIKQ